MKTKRIVAKTLESAFGENPEWMALIASNREEQVEVVFETMQAPAMAASLILSSQDAVKNIDPETVQEKLAWNLESSMQILPEALDIALVADGDVLCINIGTGALYFKLTEPAKRSLEQPGKHFGE